MLQILHRNHPGFESVQTTFEEFALAAAAANQKFGSIIALYGAATYFDKASYPAIQQLLAEGGNYFLMFYRPGYYPKHIYTADDIAQIQARQDYSEIVAAFKNKYLFSKYLVATNLHLVLEKFDH